MSPADEFTLGCVLAAVGAALVLSSGWPILGLGAAIVIGNLLA